MFGLLLQKELHQHIISLRFSVAVILCIIVIPLAIFVNLKDYEKRLRSYEQSIQLYQQEHPTEQSVARGGAKGFRKPSPFSIFSVGLEYYLPTTIHSDPDEEITYTNDRGVNNPHSMLLGKIDLIYIVSVVLSMLALLFSFNAISGEKEMGTLKLALANSLPRHKILLSKLTGTYLVLVIPFFIGLVIGLLVLLFSGHATIFSGVNLIKFCLMLLASLLLLGVFVCLGLLISSLTHNSITGIVILLLIWVAITLAYPKISTMIAEVIHPVKSDMVFALEKQTNLKALDEEERAAYTDLWERVGGAQGFPQATPDSSRWDEPTRRFMHERPAIQEEFSEKRKRLIQNLDQVHNNEKMRQAAVARNISRLSPVSAYIYAMSTMAGTGLLEEAAIKDGGKVFADIMEREVYDHVFKVKLKFGTSSSYNFISKEPPPRYMPAVYSFNDMLSYTLMDLLLLVLFNMLLFIGAYIAFLRYDAR